MVIWAIARAMKWSLYAMASVIFAAVTGVFAFWLWA